MAYTTYSNVQSMFSQLGYINVNEYVPSDICYGKWSFTEG